MSVLAAQLGAEVRMTLRRGESLLVTLGIPVGLLVFFSVVDVLPRPEGADDAVDFLAPGILALAVMSSAMVGLGIATGFERGYGVLKRLGVTPLGRGRLLAAKIGALVVVEIVQIAVLVPVALVLGWDPSGSFAAGLAAALVATVAFAGIGLVLAGRLSAELNLAAANGLYLVLLLSGGMVIPLGELPGPLRSAARALPAASLSDVLQAALGSAPGHGPARAWLVLGAWAVAAPAVATRVFRWE